MYLSKNSGRNCYTFATTNALSQAELDTSDLRPY
jgi:hypothetical protein